MVHAVLAVLGTAACTDDQPSPTAPEEPAAVVEAEAAVAAATVTTAFRLLEDALFLELLDDVGADTEWLKDATRDATAAPTHVMTLARELSRTARWRLAVPTGEEDAADPDDEIHRAVLELMLDDAVGLLSAPAPGGESAPQDTTLIRRSP